MTQEELKKQLRYNPNAGIFTWNQSRPRVSWGKVAGTYDTKGYLVIKIDWTAYMGHRLAWLYMTGEWPDNIDHKDLNKSNNKWDNLRDSTHAQNLANTGIGPKNTSGVKGVNWNKQLKKWCAEIKIKGKKHFLGYYDGLEKATYVRREFASRMLGEFARHK